MRFALLGDHPDGIDLVLALAQSGRHQILACTTILPEEISRRLGGQVRRIGDVEEVLADPAIEVVIVAGRVDRRAAQLRRALQSERHVLCVHPPDQTPEIAYEAAMLRSDTGCVLLPLLPETTHPAIRRLAEFVCRKDGKNSPVGVFRLLEMERSVADEVLDGIELPGQKPAFPGWDILRAIGGEIQEVSAFAEAEELQEGQPVLLAGRFEGGGLFQVALLPRSRQPHWRLAVIGTTGRSELYFPQGWNGPAILDWRGGDSEPREEYWQQWDPWPTLIETFERSASPAGSPADEAKDKLNLSWQDAIRALELDDAARRGVEKRRSTVLEYPEATEEVGFKGTMTLLGCSLLWSVLLLLILSVWWPKLGFLIVPLIVVFLGLQFLRYLLPQRNEK
jgi:predicted dehydrogenase